MVQGCERERHAVAQARPALPPEELKSQKNRLVRKMMRMEPVGEGDVERERKMSQVGFEGKVESGFQYAVRA